jgi:hypothetical protein
VRLILPLSCALALGCDGGEPPLKLILLHSNDEHSHLLGFGPEGGDRRAHREQRPELHHRAAS